MKGYYSALSTDGCELQVQTSYSGLVNNDFDDFKKRVDDSLKKLADATPAKPSTPDASTAPPK
jgi:hypothetical protein